MLQQTNPELMGSHPHAHQQQQQSSQQQSQQQQQPSFNQVRQARASAYATHAGAAHLSLTGGATTAATAAIVASTAAAATTLPLQLSEQQCNNISNNLNNSNSFVVNELNAIKFGQQQQQQQLVGGLLGSGDANGLLTSSVSSSISNLLISDNLTTTSDAAANKIHALWHQSGGQQQPQHQQQQLQQQPLQFSNTTDMISSLWSSHSSGSSNSSSGCSTGSASSQPSLSPTATTMHQNYRSNSKESLWSLSQTSPTNHLRESFYSVKNAGSAGVAASVGNTAISPISSAASTSSQQSSSSCCSAGLGSLEFGKNGNSANLWSCNNSYFDASVGLASPDEAQQYAKISNIWDIPHPAAGLAGAAATAVATSANVVAAGKDVVTAAGGGGYSRSNDLFNDLWSNSCSVNSGNGADACVNTDASNIWRTPSSGGRALLKQQLQQQQPRTQLRPLDGNLFGNGATAAAAGDAANCMQLFSEEFLNYLKN